MIIGGGRLGQALAEWGGTGADVIVGRGGEIPEEIVMPGAWFIGMGWGFEGGMRFKRMDGMHAHIDSTDSITSHTQTAPRRSRSSPCTCACSPGTWRP